MAFRRPSKWFAVFTGFCVCVFASLGVWQLQRLQWKESFIEERAAKAGASPVAPPPVDAPRDAIDQLRVRISGTWSEHPGFNVGLRRHDGVMGTTLHRFLELSDGAHVLVRVGWCPIERTGRGAAQKTSGLFISSAKAADPIELSLGEFFANCGKAGTECGSIESESPDGWNPFDAPDLEAAVATLYFPAGANYFQSKCTPDRGLQNGLLGINWSCTSVDEMAAEAGVQAPAPYAAWLTRTDAANQENALPVCIPHVSAWDPIAYKSYPIPQDRPIVEAPSLDVPNNHLQYAITWFAVMGAVIVLFGVSCWRKR